MKQWIESRVSCIVLFLFIFSFGPQALGQGCNDLLSSVPGDYMSFVNQAESARGESKKKHPEFLNPESEKKLAQLWKGELGPEALQRLLPPGVTFVGHQLRKAAAPGVVKVEQKSGDFLILRVEMPFNGRTIATNVTVNAQALYNNIHRSLKGEKLWLIGPDATAAMDWGHGGGTKTTGGHTADTLMNYLAKYNVFTFGMDQPWHGEGPRVWFEDDEEYFKFRVAFRKQFVHPDVPTFLVGHSKGGLVADMAVRRTGAKYKKIGLDEAYVGMIPLSFVPDDKPGGTYSDKTTEARYKEALQKEAEIMARINPGDCSLFANLMAEDKISALSGLMCTHLSMFNSWLEMEASLPSLYVMGEHDGLYVTKEKLIEEHVRSLKNATLWTFSSRVSFRGEVEPVGHMIFDHYMPKKNHPEALAAMTEYLTHKLQNQKLPESEEELQTLFKEKVLKGHVNEYSFMTPVNNYTTTLVLMGYQWVPEFKNFLENRIGALAQEKGVDVSKFMPKYFLQYTEEGVFETYQVIKNFVARVLADKGIELKEVSLKQRLETAQKEGDPLANQRESILSLLKAYGNNLAFREFLKSFSYIDTGATKEFETLNRVGGALTQRIKMLNSIRKEKISDEEKQKKIAELEPIVDDQGNTLEPGDAAGVQAALDRIQEIRNKKWIPEEGELKEFAAANVKARDDIHRLVKELEAKRDQLKKEWEQLKKETSALEARLENALEGAESPAIRAYEARREKLYTELETYDLKVRDIQDAFLVKVIENQRSMVEAFEQLPKELLAAYEDAERASQNYQALLQEGQALREKEALQGALGSEVQKMAQELLGPQGLKERLAAKVMEYAKLEYQDITEARDRQDQLLADYIKQVMPRYFKVTEVKVADALNAPVKSLEDLKETFKFAEKALSQWRGKVLISKPEGGDSSLY